ncbi:MAG: phosphopentomutase, partial [Thermacetogeniaceae bacterium]
LLDALSNRGFQVVAVGKVNDIFAGQGVTKSIPVAGNQEIFNAAKKAFQELERGLVFATLVDFDSLYGHRNDIKGFAKALEAFDSWLPDLLENLEQGDLLVLTADHGCDPTTASTDHSREYVPLLITGPGVKVGSVGVRSTMADLGATLAKFFAVEQGDGTPIAGIYKE